MSLLLQLLLLLLLLLLIVVGAVVIGANFFIDWHTDRVIGFGLRPASTEQLQQQQQQQQLLLCEFDTVITLRQNNFKDVGVAWRLWDAGVVLAK